VQSTLVTAMRGLLLRKRDVLGAIGEREELWIGFSRSGTQGVPTKHLKIEKGEY
jgi:hypothetical protein